MPTASRRGGFSIIELLVGMSILGVLSALVFPALQGVRQAGYKAQCCNNLRQLGMAAHQYQQVHGRLPDACTMGYAQPAKPPSITDASGLPPLEVLDDSNARLNSDPNNPFGPNWIVYLLPYLEQLELYQQANPGNYLIGYQSKNKTLRDGWRNAVKDKVLPFLLCPADSGQDRPFQGYPGAPGPWARGNYASNAGPGWWQMSFRGNSYQEGYGRTGPMMGINFGEDLYQVKDGASNTILFNEIRVGQKPNDPRGAWAMGFPGSSVTAANAIGDCTTPNDLNELSDDLEGCPDFWYPGIGTRDRFGCSTGLLNLGWPSWQAQARSQHRGGVHVCMGDGSVRFIQDTILQGVWFYLLSTKDGNHPWSYEF